MKITYIERDNKIMEKLERTAKWERLTMVQAVPGVQPKTERTTSQEKKRMSMYVVHTPGYVNHSVFRFISAGGTAFTYKFAIVFLAPQSIDGSYTVKFNSILGFSEKEDEEQNM